MCQHWYYVYKNVCLLIVISSFGDFLWNISDSLSNWNEEQRNAKFSEKTEEFFQDFPNLRKNRTCNLLLIGVAVVRTVFVVFQDPGLGIKVALTEECTVKKRCSD